MRKFRRIMCDSCIIVCVIMIIFSVVKLIQYKDERFEQKKMNHELQQIKEKELKGTENSIKKEDKKILKGYRNLHRINKDMYGWLKIRGTEIDYPVMFIPGDTMFYENRNWDKKEVDVGNCIWIDGRTTETSKNIIIYGHNMRNKTMFGSLKDYKDIKFYKKHKYIQFDTLYKRQTFEIISVSKVSGNPIKGEYWIYKDVELNSKEEFNKYIENVKKRAYYNINTTASYSDKLITLSTCDGNERLIIVAKKQKNSKMQKGGIFYEE